MTIIIITRSCLQVLWKNRAIADCLWQLCNWHKRVSPVLHALEWPKGGAKEIDVVFHSSTRAGWFKCTPGHVSNMPIVSFYNWLQNLSTLREVPFWKVKRLCGLCPKSFCATKDKRYSGVFFSGPIVPYHEQSKIQFEQGEMSIRTWKKCPNN